MESESTGPGSLIGATLGGYEVVAVIGRGLRLVKQVTTFDDGVKSLGPVSVDSGSMMVCGGTDAHPVLMLLAVSRD